MLAKSSPVPTLGIMNIMNLRELIERCKEESELEPVLSKLSIYQVQGTTFMQIGLNPPHTRLVLPIFLTSSSFKYFRSPTNDSSKLYAPKY